MSEVSLPSAFRDLAPFAGWSLADERARQQLRLRSSMAEIRSLYDAMLPRMEEIIGYLNRFPLAQMPEEAKALLWLALSFAEIAPSVELFGQQEVPAGVATERLIRVDVPHMNPVI